MAWIPTEQFLKNLPAAVHGVATIVPDQRGCILLLHDAFDQDRAESSDDMIFDWWLPGGLMGHNESPARAALRELDEETGLKAGGLRIVGSNYESARPHWPAVTDYYFATPALDEEQVAGIMLSPEHQGYRFVSPDQVKDLVSERRLPVLLELLAAWSANTTCTLFDGHPVP